MLRCTGWFQMDSHKRQNTKEFHRGAFWARKTLFCNWQHQKTQNSDKCFFLKDFSKKLDSIEKHREKTIWTRKTFFFSLFEKIRLVQKKPIELFDHVKREFVWVLHGKTPQISHRSVHYLQKLLKLLRPSPASINLVQRVLPSNFFAFLMFTGSD